MNEDNIKLEVAIEIMASKLANMIQKGYTTEDKEIQDLLKEKTQMYAGNKEIIEKILEVYGKELKNTL